jgi:hypothetical protein
MLIGGVDVEKLTFGHKVALDVMHPVFDPSASLRTGFCPCAGAYAVGWG